MSILRKSGANIDQGGTHLADRRNTVMLEALPAQDEAAAVASALGIPRDLPDPDLQAKVSQIPHITVNTDGGVPLEANVSPELNPDRSPISEGFSESNEGAAVMKSPESTNLSSPEVSESENDDGESSTDDEETKGDTESRIQAEPLHREEVTKAAAQAQQKAQEVERRTRDAESQPHRPEADDDEDEDVIINSKLAQADGS
jgi:hypothetical protein